MSRRIESADAIEILDSRGLPTLRVRVALEDGACGVASVPSGASTGTHEAFELRDGDPRRYRGMGVTKAIKNLNTEIAALLIGRDATDQANIDAAMIELDGTPNKSRLGANAILGASQAVACAAANSCGLPLYGWLGERSARQMPVPMINVLNGGKHADSSLDFQEFMIVPRGAPTFAEALRYGSETFQALKSLLQEKNLSTAVGDEGGFAPRLEGGNEMACALLVNAITRAGYRPGVDIAIALDAAASSFFKEGKYHLSRSGEGEKTAEEMIRLFTDWIQRYPIISIEDGLAEDDWAGFTQMTAALGEQIQIVGDDLLVTNADFIARGIGEKACNAALIKLNQIGTISETLDAIRLCRQAGWRFVVSHRSGETEDSFIADFAVAMDGGQIKTGSICRSERVAKYNRLLEIEAQLGEAARFRPLRG